MAPTPSEDPDPDPSSKPIVCEGRSVREVVHPDSGVDLDHRTPDRALSPAPIPPDCEPAPDWARVTETLEERLRQRIMERVRKDKDITKALYLQKSVLDATSIKGLVDFEWRIPRAESRPPKELGLKAEEITILEEKYGANFFEELDIL